MAEEVVFYFGNAPGEVGNATDQATVDIGDLLLTRNNIDAASEVSLDSAYDHNRDRVVNDEDVQIVQDNMTNFFNRLHLLFHE